MFFKAGSYKGFYGDFVEAFYNPACDNQTYNGYDIDLFLEFEDYRDSIPEGYHYFLIPSDKFTLNLPDYVSLLSDGGVIDNDMLHHYSPIKFPVLVNSYYSYVGTATSPPRMYGILPFTVLVTLTYSGTEWVQSYDSPDHVIFWSFAAGANVGTLKLHTLCKRFKASFNFLLPFPPLPFSSDNLLGGDSL